MSQRTANPSGDSIRKARKRDALSGYAFIAPYFAALFFMMVYPILNGLYISFHEWDILGVPDFTGIENYHRLFTDSVFWSSLRNTLEFTALSVPLLIILGLLVALALNESFRGRSVFRGIFFFPYLLSISVATTIWIWLLQNRYGLLNYYLREFGIAAPDWLNSTTWAMPAIVITTLWWTMGFNLIIFLAGLQDIPEQLYEAARIDGANPWHCFRHITLPGLRRIFRFVIIMQVIASLKIFGQVYIMTEGGPFGSTRVLSMYLYEQAFTYFRMGYASAVGYVFLVIVMILTFVQWKIMGAEERD